MDVKQCVYNAHHLSQPKYQINNDNIFTFTLLYTFTAFMPRHGYSFTPVPLGEVLGSWSFTPTSADTKESQKIGHKWI
jgi:hypothetical protein